MKKELLSRLPDVLLPWYRKNRRDLPWRHDRDPYHVWLSEIMLQQTRVEAVKDYYLRFVRELPDIDALAQCDDERLHKLWEGLGYYSRVRNLKKAAQVILDRHNGQFPRTHQDVLDLPGIGPYTAGAICSIAFDLPTPAVDGNVLRVLSRLRADEESIDLPAHRKRVQRELEAVYPADSAGDFTQALMELGATLCGPNWEPRCGECPCREFCRGQTNWKRYPVKYPKKDRRTEQKTLFLLCCRDRYAIEKRPEQGLLAGLWQFPNVDGWLEPQDALRWAEKQGLKPLHLNAQLERSHIFTHIRWDMRAYHLQIDNPSEHFVWMTLNELDEQAALPTAFRQFREEIEYV